MLKHLYDLAIAEKLLDDPNYEWKSVRYFIDLGANGSVNIVDRKDGDQTPTLRIPLRIGRSSGVVANFLVDNVKYVFGWHPEKEKDASKASEAFKAKIEEAVNATTGEVKVALQAILTFLNLPLTQRIAPLEKLMGNGASKEIIKSVGSADYAFRYLPYAAAPIHLYPEVEAYWATQCVVEAGEPTSTCVVTGLACEPVEFHPKVNIPGSGITIPLFSFNEEAFESYGLSGNQNCSMSVEASRAVAAAVSRLLSPNPIKSGEDKNIPEKLGKRNVRIGEDTSACFWIKADKLEDAADPECFMLGFENPNPATLDNLLRTPYNGHKPALTDTNPFMMMIIQGVSGRPIFRNFSESTTSKVAENILQYAKDLDFVKPKDGTIIYPNVYALVSSLNGSKAKSSLKANYVTAIMSSAFNNTKLPRAILQAAVNRIGAEGPYDEKYNFYKRLSLIKLYLTRSTSYEVTMSLNTENTNSAYLCGRLMAFYEKLQSDASGEVGKTVVDSSYRAFRNTPAKVNARLVTLMNNHNKKLRRDNHGLKVHMDQVYHEITGKLENFSIKLTTEEQGMFDIGYAHQRASFYTKKIEKEVTTEVE